MVFVFRWQGFAVGEQNNNLFQLVQVQALLLGKLEVLFKSRRSFNLILHELSSSKSSSTEPNLFALGSVSILSASSIASRVSLLGIS